MTDALWSFVDLTDGEFTGGQAYGGLGVGFAQPAHILPVLGDYRPDAWRYDLQLLHVVPKTASPAPTRRDLELSVSDAVAALVAIESQCSLRAMRELLLALARGDPVPPEALQRLEAIDGEVEARRADVRAALARLADPNG